ncbi:MAG TPA: SGNH/GDSL hydrolase family protein [Polyangiales bacterium]|nr:SGNH/GDSL hydrolase family protein [Polyangiales bacterium]
MRRRISVGLLVLGSLPLAAACSDSQSMQPIGGEPGATAGMTPSAAGETAVASAGTGGSTSTQAGAPSTPKAGSSAAGSSGDKAGSSSPTPAAGTGGEDTPAAGAGAGGDAGASGAAAGSSGSAAGAGGGMEGQAGAAGSTAVPAWMTREDLGKGDGSDVITIGDSWMDYALGGGGIQAGLDRAGTRYRHYALSGTTLLSGQIPGQYTSAKRSNPKILTAIMTGGGNDIMFSNSCSTAERCEAAVKELIMAWDKLWTQMAADGVKDVILINYSADAGTAPTTTRPKMVDPAPICLSGKINCHSLATTELVMGSLVDGIHPTAAANDRIAKALLGLMEERKIRR